MAILYSCDAHGFFVAGPTGPIDFDDPYEQMIDESIYEHEELHRRLAAAAGRIRATALLSRVVGRRVIRRVGQAQSGAASNVRDAPADVGGRQGSSPSAGEVGAPPRQRTHMRHEWTPLRDGEPDRAAPTLYAETDCLPSGERVITVSFGAAAATWAPQMAHAIGTWLLDASRVPGPVE